ncbi:MAG: PilZ domain-containing protein [Acidobacteriaceae bacterium]
MLDSLMPGREVRSERRFLIAAPVAFWWPGQEGTMQAAKGRTLDISKRGVRVRAAECPPKGALIQLTIVLPRMSDSGHTLTLQGEGVVIRVDHDGENSTETEETAFAALVQFYPERRILEPINTSTTEAALEPSTN